MDVMVKVSVVDGKTSAIALNGDRTAYFNFTGQYILYVRDCEVR